MTDPTPAHGCTINGQPAIPIPISEYNQLTARATEAEAALERAETELRWWAEADSANAAAGSYAHRAEHAEAALARVRELARNEQDNGNAIWPNDLLALLDEPTVGPAATPATEQETTARVLAALHRSAEQDVSRVIDLYERWVKAGPPPLGASMARWWDARLAELHDAIRPPEQQEQQ